MRCSRIDRGAPCENVQKLGALKWTLMYYDPCYRDSPTEAQLIETAMYSGRRGLTVSCFGTSTYGPYSCLELLGCPRVPCATRSLRQISGQFGGECPQGSYKAVSDSGRCFILLLLLLTGVLILILILPVAFVMLLLVMMRIIIVFTIILVFGGSLRARQLLAN